MKELCRVKIEGKYAFANPYKVVVEVAKDINKEVLVQPYQYDTSKNPELFITSGGITLQPKTLMVSCSNVSVPEILLHVELCKFVLDSNPELRSAAA